MTASAALPRLVRVAVTVAVLLHPAMPSSVVYSKQPRPAPPPPPPPLFDVVWNSDFSVHCQAVNATLRLEQNGIRANAEQAWFGRTIATLYGAGAAMPSAAGPNGSIVNGGIPQLANRRSDTSHACVRHCTSAARRFVQTASWGTPPGARRVASPSHLLPPLPLLLMLLRSLIEVQTQTLLKAAVPADFDGLGVFDIEYPQLYPLWQYDFGPDDQLVRRMATNYTAARSGLSGGALAKRTAADFNSGMAALWQLQLATAKQLYPHATFGYYRMPHCWYLLCVMYMQHRHIYTYIHTRRHT